MARFAEVICRVLITATLVSLFLGGGAQPASAGSATRVSVDSAGRQANGPSSAAAISADGRFVAFESNATNLVAGDTNGLTDIFVHDLVARTTTRVSVDSLGRQANGPSFNPSISSDGRFVAFESNATNLVTGDTNGLPDIFVRDLLTGKTTRVSVDSLGRQANGSSYNAAISADGRFVAFESDATNLVMGDTNGKRDVFVYDMTTRATARVSVDSLGRQTNGPSYSAAISADGRFVAFESDATNLVTGDTNGKRDVFVHDATTRATTRVSVDSLGRQSNGPSSSAAISGDGRFVAFESDATNLVAGDTNGKRDIFVYDMTTRATTRVSVDSLGRQSNGPSFNAAISADGRFVAFESDATNLVPSDSLLKGDVFVRDLVLGSTARASVDSAGRQALGASSGAAISGDGRSVAFESDANNLVPGDTNLTRDIFVHDLR
jgi:Tol biopolymer transport system component